MSDIFREVEEDVRRDQLEKFWKANGGYIIALIVVSLLGLGGWQLWQTQQTKQREKDSAAFTAAQKLTDPKAAAKAFADLAQSAGGGYAALAKIEQANLLLTAGKRAEAVAIYMDVAADQGPVGSVARLRAGWAQADTASRTQLQTLLQPLLDPSNAWKTLAQEILAYNDYRNGKLLVASGEFNKLAADTTASDALRNRAHAFSVYIAGGGAANVGTVPPTAPVPVLPAGAAAP